MSINVIIKNKNKNKKYRTVTSEDSLIEKREKIRRRFTSVRAESKT